MKFLLPILVFWPACAAPVSYIIGRFSKSARDLFVGAATLAELAFAILLFINGAGEFSIPNFCGLGISFVGDGFRCLMALITAIGWFTATMMLREYFSHSRNRNRYYCFWLLTLCGTIGVFLSADLFTTFIFFELMSFASWVMVIHTEKEDAMKAAETYLAVAVIGGLVTLMGVFMLYKQLGTVRIDELYDAAQAVGSSTGLWVASLLTLFGFAAKAGSFPLHIWLPTAHPAAPAPASAVLSGVIIKTGVFGILVLSTQVFRHNFSWGSMMLVLGVITMLLGAVLAVFSNDLKRTFACSSVSQIGFILVGIAMQCLLGHHNALAVDGTLLHVVNHASIKLILFPAAGVIYCSTHCFDLNKIRGFGHDKPLLAVIMAIPMASLAGVPGLNGYVSKTLLHESIVEYVHLVPETAVLFTVVEWLFLLAGALTAVYMLKLFICIFVQKPHAELAAHMHKPYASKLSLGTLLALVAILPVMGLFPNQVMDSLAALGRGFMHGEAPAHAVHYFTWVNLKGAVISLAMGIVIYLAVVLTWLCKWNEEDFVYLQRWPQWLNLETGIYRPLLQRFLPFVGAVAARAGEGIVDGTCALLTKLLYHKQSRNVVPQRDEEFAAYKPKPGARLGFQYSFAYSIMLTGLGLSAALLYVLFKA